MTWITRLRLAVMTAAAVLLAAPWAAAFEIITKKDIVQGVIVREDLIKTADNAVILFDASSSMEKPYKDTGRSRYEIARQSLRDRNAFFPDLGYNIGLYLYTPWKAIYPVQPYDRETFAKALDTLPEQAGSGTFLTDGLKRLDRILASLQGRTAVFLYTDGSYRTKGAGMRSPADIAEDLAKKYNVCFYIVSTADDIHSRDLFERAKEFNFCSRVIGFDRFIEYPMFNSEALFTVKATKDIVTITDRRVVGIKTRNFLFDYDRSDLSESARERLDFLAVFLKSNPNAYAAMAGHADGMGTPAYNLRLSHDRVDRIARYLIRTHDVDPAQLITFWFGDLNPVADNDTPEGRARNRRVEIVLGGF